MKKTIVIVILVVYIASIAVVNFFGLAIKEFDGVEYVQEIKCNSITVLNGNNEVFEQHNKDAEGEMPEFRFDFIKGDYTTDPASIASNPNRVRINYEVLPHTADGSKVTFAYDKEGLEGIVHFDEETQTFVFLKRLKRIEVTIKATDGSNVQTTIKIMGK